MTGSFTHNSLVTGRLNIAKFPGINPAGPGGQYDPLTNGVGMPVGGVLLQQHGCGYPADVPFFLQLLQPDKDGWLYCLRACFGVGADAQALCPTNLGAKGCQFAIVRRGCLTALMPAAGRLRGWHLCVRVGRPAGALLERCDGRECVNHRCARRLNCLSSRAVQERGRDRQRRRRTSFRLLVDRHRRLLG